MNGLACKLVEAWVRLYTLGMPAPLRRDRVDLILADIADEMADTAAEGAPPAASLLGRCLRGVPADLTWRLFDARHVPYPRSPFSFELERKPVMDDRAANLPFFAVSAGIAWAAVLVLAVEGVPHSLSYAGGLLSAVALTGWTLEARRTGDEAPPTASPLLLATGIVALAAGAVFTGERLGLVTALPLAVGLSIALARTMAATLRESVDANPRPLQALEIADRAALGDAIAIEAARGRSVSRRAVLRGSFGLGLASALAAMGGVFVDFLWQRNVAGFGGVVTAGATSEFPPGTKTRVRAGKFWLVNLTAEQGGPGFLALWQKCPHLGCVVPWESGFSFVDPESGDSTRGWFRCPCHQSTYNHAGVRVFGPAPRSMDRMAVRINEDDVIEVDTGDISKGSDDNAGYAVRASS
jgi:cytochrome b6-f complex iron-sulfur subunit